MGQHAFSTVVLFGQHFPGPALSEHVVFAAATTQYT